jgi:ATP-binding cassette, subfamily B, bacterial MsbA
MATSDAHYGVSAGAFVSMIAAMLAILKPMKTLTTVNSTIQKGVAAAEEIFEILDSPGETDTGTQIIQATGKVSVQNLCFYYDSMKEKSILSDISFEILPGQMIALVGRSGAGKSTLAALLPRFYEATAGHIYLDGVSICDLTLKNLREQIAVVSQQVVLFNDTIANNIAYGLLNKVSESEIIHAAKAAHAWPFIEAMPQGLQTLIGEDGILLSGGQRQRLAIARAILKNAPILILDEATSSLDTESERHIQAALDELMRGRTSLVIAHRLSTIEHADLILVMDKGRLVEKGKHADLLKSSGDYAHFYQLQFSSKDKV